VSTVEDAASCVSAAAKNKAAKPNIDLAASRWLKLLGDRKLERKFRGKLNTAGPAAPQERIADPHVAASRDVVRA
jgi:hypothetical protein